jgi:iron(III) transport system permease protein
LQARVATGFIPRPTGVRAGWGFLQQRAVTLVILLLLFWVVGAPIIFLVGSSFNSGTPVAPGSLTLANYVAVYTSRLTYPALLNTVVYAGVVSVIGVVLATLFAWLIERTDMPGRDVAWTLMLLPLAMPGLLASMAWILLLQPKTGLLNLPLRGLLDAFGVHLETGPLDIYTLPGMILVESIRGSTTLFLLIVGAFRVMDPALEDAARLSGATTWQTFRRVTAGLLRPALLAAGMYAFISNLEDFDTPLLIGLPAGIYLLPTLIFFSAFAGARPQFGLSSAYASIFLIITVLLVLVYYRIILQRASRFATITGKGYRPQRVALGSWRLPALVLFVVYFVLTVALPVLVLVYASLLPTYSTPDPDVLNRLTFVHYAAIFREPNLFSAIVNTSMLSAITATGTVVLAFLVSWLVVRQRVWGAPVIDAFAFLPHAIPTIAVGTALIMLYLHPAVRWIGIYGTIWIMALALTTRYLAFASRTFNAAMTQVGRELEEAAYVSGANRVLTVVRVTAPLLLPTVIGGWIWVAAGAIRNLTIPLMLSSAGTQTVATLLYDYWERRGNFSLASALGVTLLVGMTILIFLARRLIARGYA